jgi:hypothetical protein
LIRKGKALVFSTGGNELLDQKTVEKINAKKRDRRTNYFIREMKQKQTG